MDEERDRSFEDSPAGSLSPPDEPATFVVTDDAGRPDTVVLAWSESWCRPPVEHRPELPGLSRRR